MQVIYGQGLASNITLTAQKRLIRPVYAQTQGYPYAAYIDPFLRLGSAATVGAPGSFYPPQSNDASGTNVNNRATSVPTGLTYGTATFTYQGSVVPGTVMIKTASEYVAPHPGGGAWSGAGAGTVQPFGLLGQWLGGTFDNLGQNNQVGVWMGPDSVFEILSPGFNAGGIPAALNSAGTNVPMYAGNNGLLSVAGQNGAANTNAPVCYLLDYPSADRILVKMAI